MQLECTVDRCKDVTVRLPHAVLVQLSTCQAVWHVEVKELPHVLNECSTPVAGSYRGICINARHLRLRFLQAHRGQLSSIGVRTFQIHEAPLVEALPDVVALLPDCHHIRTVTKINPPLLDEVIVYKMGLITQPRVPKDRIFGQARMVLESPIIAFVYRCSNSYFCCKGADAVDEVRIASTQDGLRVLQTGRCLWPKDRVEPEHDRKQHAHACLCAGELSKLVCSFPDARRDPLPNLSDNGVCLFWVSIAP
mmetsp:Transcript_59899/g.142719  ORF Transcript_59899/g.142719 Transcript_59899/m.142719 type:complete len:251 (-) Transcript_59899:889-1641(-)